MSLVARQVFLIRQNYTPDCRPLPIERLSNQYLASQIRRLEAESQSLLNTHGEEIPDGNLTDWMLGLEVDFLPFKFFPEYLGLIHEALARRMDVGHEFKPRQIRHWKKLLKRFPP